jgi:hypothetical protein
LIELLNHGLKTQIVTLERWRVNLTNNYICEKLMVNECTTTKCGCSSLVFVH